MEAACGLRLLGNSLPCPRPALQSASVGGRVVHLLLVKQAQIVSDLDDARLIVCDTSRRRRGPQRKQQPSFIRRTHFQFAGSPRPFECHVGPGWPLMPTLTGALHDIAMLGSDMPVRSKSPTKPPSCCTFGQVTSKPQADSV